MKARKRSTVWFPAHEIMGFTIALGFLILTGCTGPAANTFGNVLDNANEVVTTPDNQIWDTSGDTYEEEPEAEEEAPVDSGTAPY